VVQGSGRAVHRLTGGAGQGGWVMVAPVFDRWVMCLGGPGGHVERSAVGTIRKRGGNQPEQCEAAQCGQDETEDVQAAVESRHAAG